MLSVLCLATAIFFEARGEPYDGQLAVGQVIRNRVESTKFPDSVCQVIEQHKQFSFTHDGKSDNMFDYDEPEAWIASLSAATEVLSGNVDLVPTSTHYHTPAVSPKWSKVLLKDGQIGNHIFYSE